jgi:hypothetical protein
MLRPLYFDRKSITIVVLVSISMTGCAANQGTIAPPMPIPMTSAKKYAQQKQQGINVTRQFAGLWESAKHTMENSFSNCLAVSNADGGSTDNCWNQLKTQATGYANQFSGLYANGLQGAQQEHFAMARQSAVTYFQLLETYAKQCINNVRICLQANNPTKSAIADAKEHVNQLLAGTVVAGSVGSVGNHYESGEVNNNLSGLSNSPSAIAPSAEVPALQNQNTPQ